MNKDIAHIIKDSKSLLAQLIEIPSFSKQEDKTAECIANFLTNKGVAIKRGGE